MIARVFRLLTAVGFGLLLMHGSRPVAAHGATVARAQPAMADERFEAADTPTVTGPPVPELQSFDDFMTQLMLKWQIPGAALAVVKDGRLVLAHGYGLADVDTGEPVQPDSLFRIASLSKQFTSAGVLSLVEQGELDLDTPAFSLLPDLTPAPGASEDPRLSQITVRELLQHTGGWDRDQSFDPMFRPIIAAKAVDAPAPASCQTVIRYMLGQPLDFDPGTRYAYSNFGYCVLGRVIEHVSGQSYADFIASQILAPAGISDMREGHSLPEGRAAGEVHYYDYPGAPLANSVFPDVPGKVPAPYGGFYLEAMDSHGGWLASPIDLLKFLTALDGDRPPMLLEPQTIALMTGRPARPVSVGTPAYYGMGWMVRPVTGGANWWHDGSLPGTESYVARLANGWSWAAAFNSRPKNSDSFGSAIDSGLGTAAGAVKQWPNSDLFPQYP